MKIGLSLPQGCDREYLGMDAATAWARTVEAARWAEDVGFESLWINDHMQVDPPPEEAPIFEPFVEIAALAVETRRARLGHLVLAAAYRNAGLTAKAISTVDVISGGRAILGIGAAWFGTEHKAYGLPFGSGPPERLRWLGEALPVMRGMLAGERPSAGGVRYHADGVRNDPMPVQRRLPLLVGGGGEQVTLKLVARYADANNLGGGFENVKRKDAILRQHCETVGRDEKEIERTAGIGSVIIRDSREEARRVQASIFAANGNAPVWENQPVGTPEDVIEMLAPYSTIGYNHLIAGFPGPHDEESMTRLITEVKPKLQAS